MIYNSNNARGSDVYDIDGRERIDCVIEIDVECGLVEVAKWPVRANHMGEIDRETIKFDSIRPIFGGGVTPCSFHCYGRKAA